MLSINDKFSILASKDGRSVITKKGKMEIFQLFKIVYKNFPMSFLWELDDHDVFLWCQYEDENPKISEIFTRMVSSIEKFAVDIIDMPSIREFLASS